MFRSPFRTLLAFTLFAPAALAVHAQSPNLAQDGLAQTITQLSADPAGHEFELGMLQTLRAVEKTLQTRYEYNLNLDQIGLPILRLDTGGNVNPSAKPSTPDTLSTIIDTFTTDMVQARATLEHAEAAGITTFDLTLQDLWFDINGNGTREETESVITALGPVVLGPQAYHDFTQSDTASAPLTVRFDAADHAWLMAYTHMLSGFGNLFMAFDPAPVLQDLADQRATLANAPEIPNHYDLDALAQEIARLDAMNKEMNEQVKELDTQIRDLYDEQNNIHEQLTQTEDESLKAELQAQIDRTIQDLNPLQSQQRELRQASRLIRNDLAAAHAKMPYDPNDPEQLANVNRALTQAYGQTIDLVYITVTALAQQPDPARISAAHDDWRAMIRHNRTFWARLAEETDNDREWIPSPSQTSALPVTVPENVATGWQNILADAESVLDGKLLIPHPLLPAGYGISLPAYVNDPSPLDLIGWIHGIGAYRYAARGPLITGQSWQAFQRLTEGNGGGFALFLN